MIGRTLQQYRIEEKLGEGGMGSVYRAFDTRLKRDVAVKVLSASEQREEERARLLAEARAAAPLTHPAIAQIYEVAEADDLAFIVMELVSGRTLRESFADRPCPPRELARIGVEIAGGLQAAHDRGVVHGDVKLDNLMVCPDERIKILDFGVARRSIAPELDKTLSAGDVAWSAAGKTGGTLAYMAPEQLRGEKIDGRADLYALGVVLHELACGKLPHDAASVPALMAAILSDAPTPLGELQRVKPPELVRIVGKLLAKDAGERFQSAREVAIDLRSFLRGAGTPRAAPSRRGVAVLPLELLAGREEDGFLSVALAEAVAHGLSQSTELDVRPTSAVTKYAARRVEPLVAARELDVQVLVEGSIQKLGERMRVQVQAWDAARGVTLLSVKLDGDGSDLFGLQDRLGDALARGMGVKTAPAPPGEAPAVDPRAYELYLRASERLLHYNEHDTRAAIQNLRSAVQLEPGFAAAWARLSVALVDMGALFDPAPDWYAQARETAERALRLDSGNPEAWIARARGLWSPDAGFRHAEALRDLDKACCRPGHPHDAWTWTAAVLLHVGLHGEARAAVQEALAAQPEDRLSLLLAAEVETYEANLDGAAGYYERSLALDPSGLFTNLFHPTVPLYRGELARAEGMIAAARTIVGEDSLLDSLEALLWAKRGERDRAEERLGDALTHLKSVSHAHHAHHYAAAALATLGEPERALEQLRHAAAKGLPNHPLFGTDPHFAPLRDHPGFGALMTELKRGWEAYRKEFGDPGPGS